MADTPQIQYQEKVAHYGNSSLEWRYGTLVSHALLDAKYILESARFQGVVFKSIYLIG